MKDHFIDEDMKLAVKKGASWLDSNHPEWMTRIDLNRLIMNNCTYCVIGQAVGDFYDTIEMVAGVDEFTSSNWAIENGFQAPDHELDENYNYPPEMMEYYRGLEVLWTEEVKNRLG